MQCLPPSPGALGFNLEKNVESWNFQESYFDAHLTPWWKVSKNPSGGIFLFKMAAIAIVCLLLYPKIMYFLYGDGGHLE